MSKPKPGVLVHRFTPGHRFQPRLWSVGFEVVVAIAAGLVIAGLCAGALGWLAAIKLLVACAVATAANTRWKRVEAKLPPIEQEHGDWLTLVEQIVNSPDPAERDSIYFGTICKVVYENGQPRIIETNEPAFVPLPAFLAHWCVTGATRSRKSTSFVFPGSRQIVKRRLGSLFFYALKPDPMAQRMLREAAGEARLPYYFVSISDGAGSSGWNLYADPDWLALPAHKRADIQVEAALEPSRGDPNRAYFLRQARSVFERSALVFPDVRSAYALRAALTGPRVYRQLGMAPKDYAFGSAALGLLDDLASVPVLNCTSATPGVPPSFLENSLTLRRAMRDEKPAVVCFDLSATSSASLARAVPRLVTRAVMAVSDAIGHDHHHIFHVIDECVETLNDSWGICLRQGASKKMTFGLVFQQLADLDNGSMHMVDSVAGNCSLQVYFSAKDRHARERLKLVAGESIWTLRSSGRTSGQSGTGRTSGQSEQSHEVWRPWLDDNLINLVDSDVTLAVMQVSPASAYWPHTRPQIVRLANSYRPGERERLEAAPWPEPDGVSTLANRDLAHLFPGFLRPKRDDVDADADDEDEEPQAEQEPAPPKSRRRKRRGPDPEEEQRLLAELDEQMRRAREQRGG